MRPLQAIGFLLFFLASASIGETSIRMPPTITKQPKKINIFRDDSDVTLECQADGTPNITYKWEKNGVELDQSSLPDIKGDGNGTGTVGTITIKRATSFDEGYYQCFATNEHGTAISIVSYARRAVLQVNSVTVVVNVTVREGEAFHIQVATVKSFPKPIYGWEVVSDPSDRSFQPVSLSKRIQLADHGDLYFAYAKVEDDLNGKIYKCTAYNPNSDVKSGGSYTRVIVTRVPGGAANSVPTLNLGFSSERQIVGIVNGSVTLRCFFNGKPESNINWNRPGSTLPRDRCKQNAASTELTISNIMASDEGNYTCTARNGAGADASHTIQLNIETEPSFKTTDDRPHNVNVSEGQTVTFKCKADAKPEADVVWLRNGEKITAKDTPTRYVISPDKKSLTIADICLNCKDQDRDTDIAVIQCNASNRHGYAFASGYLNVFVKTQVEVEGETFVKVDVDNGTVEVELKCSVKYDPTTTVKWTWLKREYYTGNTSKDERLESLKNLISIDKGSLKIRIDLQNTTVAKSLLTAWRQHFKPYTCVADNGISQSNKTIYLEQFVPITTPPATTTEPPPPNCFFFDLPYSWLCFVVIAGVALLIIAFFVICICCLCYHNRHRDEYDVDGKERWTGSNPEKELLANDFHESYRVETISRTLKSSKASLSSATLMRIAEESSLNDYGDDMGKFTEDGSFVGNYNSQSRGGYM